MTKANKNYKLNHLDTSACVKPLRCRACFRLGCAVRGNDKCRAEKNWKCDLSVLCVIPTALRNILSKSGIHVISCNTVAIVEAHVDLLYCKAIGRKAAGWSDENIAICEAVRTYRLCYASRRVDINNRRRITERIRRCGKRILCAYDGSVWSLVLLRLLGFFRLGIYGRQRLFPALLAAQNKGCCPKQELYVLTLKTLC